MFDSRIASEAVKNSRLKICETCEHKGTRINVNICKKCGCILQLKTQWKTTKCPAGKWGPVRD